MKIRCTLFFLFIAVFSNAQVVPGYMGKRFSIGYSNYFFVAGIGPTANAADPSGDMGINTVHCLNLEYTIRTRTNFCLSAQYGKTGMDPGSITAQVFDPSSYSGYSNYSYTYSEHPYQPMQLSSVNVGLGFKFFQSGTIAPIGKYKKLEFLLLFNHLTYKNTAFSSQDNGALTYAAIGTGDYQYTAFALTYTMGHSRVLFDKVVLDYGIRFGILPGGLWAFLNSGGDFLPSTSNSSTGLDIETRLKYGVNTRLARSQLINFHIGLSFLAF